MSVTFNKIAIPARPPFTAIRREMENQFSYWVQLPGATLSCVRSDPGTLGTTIRRRIVCKISVEQFDMQVEFGADLELNPGEVHTMVYIPLGSVPLSPWLPSPAKENQAHLFAQVLCDDELVGAFDFDIILPDTSSPQKSSLAT